MAEVRSDEVSVDKFAERLETHRKNGVKLTLVLGSRASALYRSEKLYEQVEQHSTSIFKDKTINEKFRACYETLNKRGVFDKYHREDILDKALEEMHWRNIELYLAVLIKMGLFDVIISCSIDHRLQDALKAIGMTKEDYLPYNIYKEDMKIPESRERNDKTVLVNIFGQKEDNSHTIRRTNHIGSKGSVLDFLWRETHKETIVLGYDPTWDAELGRFINRDGGEFWYINDEQPGNEHFLQALKQRRAILAGGIYSNQTYEHFVYDLFKCYGGKVSAHYLTQDYIYITIMNVDTRLREEIKSLKDELEACKSELRMYLSR
jgi:hypothetical protein